MKDKIKISLFLLSLFVSLQTLAQLSPFAFFSKAPVASCSGVLIGGYCWYLSSLGGNCDSACTTHGGYNATATYNYAGTFSTVSNCTTVLNALGRSGSATFLSCFGVPLACASNNSGGGNYVCSDTFTAPGTSFFSNNYRACACNN